MISFLNFFYYLNHNLFTLYVAPVSLVFMIYHLGRARASERILNTRPRQARYMCVDLTQRPAHHTDEHIDMFTNLAYIKMSLFIFVRKRSIYIQKSIVCYVCLLPLTIQKL